MRIKALERFREREPMNLPININDLLTARTCVFLKVTEGRGTGIPKIIREINKNGSPLPIFHTDNDRSYLTVEFPVHPLFLEESAISMKDTGQVTTEVTGEVLKLLNTLSDKPMTRSQSQVVLGLKGQANFRDRYLKPALQMELIEMIIPDKPNSSKQKYRLTEKGKRHRESINALSSPHVGEGGVRG